MGLDQAIRRMSPETAAKVLAWQESADFEDLDWREANRIDEEEYATIKELWTGRKENHIHAAVEKLAGKIENCFYVFLTKEQMAELVAKLQAVHSAPEMAAKLLPPRDGFFFGGTDINEWYFKDIEAELLDFQEILDGWDEDSRYAYWAWW